MPHIHTESGQHDLTASAFIIRTDLDEPKVLLHMHKKLGKLMQPGGHVELHENPWQAVLHEIEEETGFGRTQLHILQPDWAITQLTGVEVLPIPFCVNTHQISYSDNPHYHTDMAFVFTANSEPMGVPGEGESSDLRWLTKQETASLSDQEVVANIQEIALGVFETCLTWEGRKVTDE